MIVDCKINQGKVRRQRTQCNKEFTKNCGKYLCLLTELYDSNIQMESDVKVITLSWYDIITVFNSKDFLSKEIIVNFIKFAERNYKMNKIIAKNIRNNYCYNIRYSELCI